MKQKGAQIKAVNLYKKNILMCRGCSNCNTIFPGEYPIKDDMTQDLYLDFIYSDIVVLATPVYFGNVNAAMKNFIERPYPFKELY